MSSSEHRGFFPFSNTFQLADPTFHEINFNSHLRNSSQSGPPRKERKEENSTNLLMVLGS
jgi:hypothetical protein